MLTKAISLVASWPAGLRYIQNGDGLGTTNHELQAQDVADALGHLRNGGVQFAARPILVSRQLTLVLPMLGESASGNWSLVSNEYGNWQNTASGGTMIFRLLLPHGQQLNAVTLRWKGAAGHGALPTMPTVTLRRIDANGGDTTLGSQTDTSGNVGAYEATHDITVSGLTHTIDRTLYRYVLTMVGETGGNFVANAKAVAVKATVTCTSLPEF